MSADDLNLMDRAIEAVQRLVNLFENMQQSTAATIQSCQRLVDAIDNLELQEPEANDEQNRQT